MFTDLVRFTAYTATHGDEAAGRVLAAFRAVIREVTSDHGVRVAKWLGDGCMIVSIDQESGIATAMELAALSSSACAPLALRIGLATGRALLFEGDDYIGTAVNLAARLCDFAGPDEVLIPAEPMPNLPDGVHMLPAGEIELKGFAQPITVARLVGRPIGFLEDELWVRPSRLV